MEQDIGNITFEIDTNLPSLEVDILTPSAHSLHTNWRYATEQEWKLWVNQTIVLEQDKNRTDVSVILEREGIVLRGDLDFSSAVGFNSQFWVAWNKWILSKYISHFCETLWIVSLHACGLYHPESWRILIGIGTSGGWKTAFISAWIMNGWRVLSTEMLQIDTDGNILPWNTWDVIGGNAERFFEQNHSDVRVFPQDVIFDQTGSKCLADFSSYRVKDTVQDYSIDAAEIVFLQFGDNRFAPPQDVVDQDMSLRFIAHSASEKIESPTYFGNDILGGGMYGVPQMRNKVIHMLQTRIQTKRILWWHIRDFLSFFES